MTSRVSVNDVNYVAYWAIATDLPRMVGKGDIRIIHERLIELEEQLTLTRNYDPLYISTLQSMRKSLSA